MMPDDSCYTCLGKSVGKGTLTNAGVGLELHAPMQYYHDVCVGVLVLKIPDFIEQFLLCRLRYAGLIVNTAPVLDC